MSRTMQDKTPAATVARLETARTALAHARCSLMDAELAALSARFTLEKAETAHAAALLLAQAAAEGANETQRKAKAYEATAADRDGVDAARREWYFTEERLTRAKSYLRLAEDERRTAETLVNLWLAGLLPLAGQAEPFPAEDTELSF